MVKYLFLRNSYLCPIWIFIFDTDQAQTCCTSWRYSILRCYCWTLTSCLLYFLLSRLSACTLTCCTSCLMYFLLYRLSACTLTCCTSCLMYFLLSRLSECTLTCCTGTSCLLYFLLSRLSACTLTCCTCCLRYFLSLYLSKLLPADLLASCLPTVLLELSSCLLVVTTFSAVLCVHVLHYVQTQSLKCTYCSSV